MPESPEDAARGDIPAQFAEALAIEVSPDGLHAVVLLGTNEDPVLEPYGVVCHRVRDEWEQGAGGSAPGLWWSSLSQPQDAENLGVLSYSGVAPAGASSVTVRWHGAVRSVRVSHGYFFLAVWNVPPMERNSERPEVLSFR